MRLVIIGFGYSAAAIAREIRPDAGAITVTVRSEAKATALRAAGWDAHVFGGTTLSTELVAMLGRATHLLVSAPPDEDGDPLLAAGLSAVMMPALTRIAYLSTVGVYGDHQGGWVDEDTVPQPVSPRSVQRLAAEQAWQDFADRQGAELGIFRLSGIYGPGRSAIENLRAGTARRLVKPGQVFNRIHVGDIAGAVTAALLGDGPLGILNLTDDEPCPPQDVVAHAAGLLGMEPPPEQPFETAELSPMARSFYGENKRVSNARIKARLGYAFRFPTYREGLLACLEAGNQAV
ncbi:MAG: SDR family oxidoreductase [Beijerinckiaceae bacterium]|nr:SDR family oxidoreductase [Beijerinckiaceae bacterium]MCZ8299329.1 SDR family oxidoreductase [Beijerinckiaceae bacterium]